jgi:hypothetical protein
MDGSKNGLGQIDPPDKETTPGAEAPRPRRMGCSCPFCRHQRRKRAVRLGFESVWGKVKRLGRQLTLRKNQK